MLMGRMDWRYVVIEHWLVISQWLSAGENMDVWIIYNTLFSRHPWTSAASIELNSINNRLQ